MSRDFRSNLGARGNDSVRPVAAELKATRELKTTTKAAGLVYISANDPGIRRIKAGSGFRYVRPDGKTVKDRTTLQRIRKLGFPPAYVDVWICAHPRGHIQAMGRDSRRRKQYRYHDNWRLTRNAAKFDRMLEFGLARSRLRSQLRRDLALPGLPRAKVVATIVKLLDETRIRVGNEEYARTNKSYGLTTLRNRHVKFLREGRVLLSFRGKGGVEHEVKVDDRRLAAIVRKLEELPGQHLFQFVDDDGVRRPIDSTTVNDYLRQTMGDDFTAKDFRTWNATLMAMDLLRSTSLPSAPTERAYSTAIASVIRQVAAELRNTPAVCRKSYINPEVFTAWRAGRLQAPRRSPPKSQSREQRAIQFLKSISIKHAK